MSTTVAYRTGKPSRFCELDDLVLYLKGLVLVRELRAAAGARPDELTRFDDEITSARDNLADFVLTRNAARPLASLP